MSFPAIDISVDLTALEEGGTDPESGQRSQASPNPLEGRAAEPASADAAAGCACEEAIPAASQDLPKQARRQEVMATLLGALTLSDVVRHLEPPHLVDLVVRWYDTYMDGDCADLDVLWNLLVAEEEVSPQVAALPMAILCLSQVEHGIPVRMPAELEGSKDCAWIKKIAARRLKAAGGIRAQVDRARTLIAQTPMPALVDEPERFDKPKPQSDASMGRAQQRRAAARRTSVFPGTRIRPWMGWLAGAVGLAALAFSLLGPFTRPFDAAGYSDLLALEDGLRSGAKLSAVISDERWKDFNAEERRDAVDRLARELRNDGIEQLVLLDDSFQPCASARIPSAYLEEPLVLIGDAVFDQGKE